MTSAPTPPDAGLAAERTALAWNRSGLAVVVCVAVLLRHVCPLRGTDDEVALGLIGVAVIAWFVLLAFFTLSRRTGDTYEPRTANAFCLITLGTLLLAFVGVAASFAAT